MLVVGRRRAGKSYLVTRFAEADGVETVTHVLFTAGGLDARAAARVSAGEAVHIPSESLLESVR